MTNEDTEDVKIPKFKNWNKYYQIIFIGLLVGAGLFGIYAMVIGSINMFETPKVLSDEKINTSYPLYAKSVYYSNSMKNEVIIYNNPSWNVNNVWVGTDEEYKAFLNNQLIGDGRYSFKGPFASGSFEYKIPIRVYSASGSNILSSLFKDERRFLMVTDNVKVHYSILITGDKENLKVRINEV